MAKLTLLLVCIIAQAPMIAFWIFLTTGLATGLRTYGLIMLAVWGAPTHWIQFVSLGGSFLLLVAAYICAFSLRVGRWVAAVALVAITSYYLPALPSLWPHGGRIFHGWAYFPPAMLLLALAYDTRAFLPGAPRRLFPARASRPGFAALALFTVSALGWAGWYWQGVGQKTVETVAARWETTTTTSKDALGKQPLRFVALDSSVSVVVASDELYEHLQSEQKQTVNLEVSKTYDHGKLRGWSVYGIDGQRDNFVWLDGSLRE